MANRACRVLIGCVMHGDVIPCLCVSSACRRSPLALVCGADLALVLCPLHPAGSAGWRARASSSEGYYIIVTLEGGR